jgi:hypothetical protein
LRALKKVGYCSQRCLNNDFNNHVHASLYRLLVDQQRINQDKVEVWVRREEEQLGCVTTLCVVYWYSIQEPLHCSGYASQSRVVVFMILK